MVSIPNLPDSGPVNAPWFPTHADPFGAGQPLVLALAAIAPLVGPVAVAMYRRLVAKRLLASPTRRAVLEHVQRHPDVTAARIADALRVDYKTVQHHVRVLREFGHVTARRDGRAIRYRALASPLLKLK